MGYIRQNSSRVKEISQITIKQLLSSNTIAANDTITNANFAQLKEGFDLLNSAFGISIQNKSLNFPTGRVKIGDIKANLLRLPIEGYTSIQLNGANGQILGTGINLVNDAFIGRHAIVGDENTGGRLRLIVDRTYTEENLQPGIPGQVRFVGDDYEGYLEAGEVQATFSFDILGGSPGVSPSDTISLLYNGATAGSASFTSNSSVTAQLLVDSILSNPTGPCLAEYTYNTVTVIALPGEGDSANGDTIEVVGTVRVSS